MIRHLELQASPREAIERQGFFLERGFLSPGERTRVMEVYDATPWDGNQNYRIKQVLNCAAFGPELLEKVEALVQQVFPDEDLMLHGAFFFVVDTSDLKRSIGFQFHQDAESFFIFQENYHYLNLYLVVEKEDPANSNLTLVPFDAIDVACQALWQAAGAQVPEPHPEFDAARRGFTFPK